MFVAIWPGRAGAGSVEREEIWAGPTGDVKWRRMRDRVVLFAQDGISTGGGGLAQVAAAARLDHSGWRQRGERQRAADSRMGTYMWVAIGYEQRFQQWGDDETFLSPELGQAIVALFAAARPARPAYPTGFAAWVQALPLETVTATSLQRDGYLLDLSDAAILADPVLGKLADTPFQWIPLPAAQFAIGEQARLAPANPAVPVLLRGEPFQIQLQTPFAPDLP